MLNKMEQKFEIGFFQLEKLVEACWSGSTILQFCVLQDLIDVHFYQMNNYQRKAIHSFFQTKMNFEKSIYNSDTDDLRNKIIARFDLNKQFHLEGLKEPYLEAHSFFFYDDKYWRNSMEFLKSSEVLVAEKNGKKIIAKI